MIRLLLFLAALALAAYGLSLLAENPGEVALTWGGVEYDVSLMVALGVVAGLAALLAFAWGVVRFVFRLPSLVSLAARARRREKGYAALSRGMVAVGSGDAHAANRHADEARKYLGDEPLTKLLRARRRSWGETAPARSPRSATCSIIRKPMRWAFAACISRRDAAATTRPRSALRCAPTSMPRFPGRRRRCSTITPRTATGPAP